MYPRMCRGGGGDGVRRQDPGRIQPYHFQKSAEEKTLDQRVSVRPISTPSAPARHPPTYPSTLPRSPWPNLASQREMQSELCQMTLHIILMAPVRLLPTQTGRASGRSCLPGLIRSPARTRGHPRPACTEARQKQAHGLWKVCESPARVRARRQGSRRDVGVNENAEV